MKKINKPINYTDIKNEIISDLASYIYDVTGRKPIILPVIMDVKKNALQK
jgi:mRNA degradation ribonuclease J1/J2